MFVLSPHSTVPRLDASDLEGLHRLRTYALEDEVGVLRAGQVYEYDLVWKDLPPDLDLIVTACLVSALEQGAVVAWFGFEGSFDFEHLLHSDVAGQIYAVAAGEAVRLALEDEYRLSDDWQRLLRELRDRVLK